MRKGILRSKSANKNLKKTQFVLLYPAEKLRVNFSAGRQTKNTYRPQLISARIGPCPVRLRVIGRSRSLLRPHIILKNLSPVSFMEWGCSRLSLARYVPGEDKKDEERPFSVRRNKEYLTFWLTGDNFRRHSGLSPLISQRKNETFTCVDLTAGFDNL
jgi:hypothetical protein